MSIKIENVEVVGWEPTIRGMRNPKNSWEKSDSETKYESWHDMSGGTFEIGPNDHDLMSRLAKGGPVHAKYRRMLVVYLDITAPLYWWPEFDTYKIGVVRNSCSFMHKGVSKPFEITDFSLKDERIYKILTPLRKKSYELSYPYETDEFKRYTDWNGRTYRVYRNGMVIREAFDYIDNYGAGRKRHFEEDGATLYQNKEGYFIVKLSGSDAGHISLHRLVATMWCDKPEGANQVNHIDGDKGNNSAENLEWVTAPENMQKGISAGLYNELGGLHQRYKLWKHWSHIIPIERRPEFRLDCGKGMTCTELSEKWNITSKQANELRYRMKTSENEDLFQECYLWEKIIEQLNYLRALYLETKDDKVFQQIRCLLPQGYLQKSTIMLNYEVLVGMYRDRKNHKLDEWKEFCKFIESLPYSELITTPPAKSAVNIKDAAEWLETVRNSSSLEEWGNFCEEISEYLKSLNKEE